MTDLLSVTTTCIVDEDIDRILTLDTTRLEKAYSLENDIFTKHGGYWCVYLEINSGEFRRSGNKSVELMDCVDWLMSWEVNSFDELASVKNIDYTGNRVWYISMMYYYPLSSLGTARETVDNLVSKIDNSLGDRFKGVGVYYNTLGYEYSNPVIVDDIENRNLVREVLAQMHVSSHERVLNKLNLADYDYF